MKSPLTFETLSPWRSEPATASSDFRRCCSAAVSAHKEILKHRFAQGEPASVLIRWRSDFIDELLIKAWDQFFAPLQNETPDLIAVGGYGRRELHPSSDVDLLILKPCDHPDEHMDEAIAAFLQFLWDTGLNPAQSVRSLSACRIEAGLDQTVMTTLLDARSIHGNETLLLKLKETISPKEIWPSLDFFRAKLAEQRTRHTKYHDTAYNLEPNVKEGPGALRDIQSIAWIIKRHHDLPEIDLVELGWLTPPEQEELEGAREFLWEIRFALHDLTDRAEDRLLFEYQQQLAHHFGFRSGDVNQDVEHFMQRYYRTVMGLERLIEVLMQLFEERMQGNRAVAPTPITADFQSLDGYLEANDPLIFRQRPLALFEILLLLQTHPSLKGIRASTIRLIRQNLDLIDEAFRADPQACHLFMEMLRQPVGVTHQLRRMNRYGVLAAYLPAFGRVVGRMQYDLFHVYTVDEHTLFVVRNLRRFALTAHRDHHPFANEVFQHIEKPELLYVAGLMHDIAKGCGGDHSTRGAELSEEFCLRHGIGEADTRLVNWLVKNHLLMSLTAQRKDISDPDIIHDFASAAGDQVTLDHLYLLTVADIRATNPNLWNSWRDALLRELYEQARWMFRRGLANPVQQSEKIEAVKKESLKLLGALGIDHERTQSVWQTVFNDEYFLRHHPEEVLWHTAALEAFSGHEPPLVLLRAVKQRGSVELFIYAPRHGAIFPQTTAVLDQLNLTILDARIITSTKDHEVHSYHVLEQSGQPLDDPLRQVQIAVRLRESLRGVEPETFSVQRRESRQVRHFSVPTQISFREGSNASWTQMELIATDRPGLLSKVGQAFSECGVRLYNARISTIGSRAEDIFSLTGANGLPLDQRAQREALRDAIVRRIGQT